MLLSKIVWIVINGNGLIDVFLLAIQRYYRVEMLLSRGIHYLWHGRGVRFFIHHTHIHQHIWEFISIKFLHLSIDDRDLTPVRSPDAQTEPKFP